MKSNITLIGMPGSGKSTVGIILAKHLSLGFLDTDVLIQINQQKSLQEIINEGDYLDLINAGDNKGAEMLLQTISENALFTALEYLIAEEIIIVNPN